MRTGLVAKKIGMSRYFDTDGTNIPVTLLKVDNCRVIDHITDNKHGYSAIKVSFGFTKKNKANQPTKGYFKKLKTQSSNYTKEFRVSGEGIVAIGQSLFANHFLDGQYVDVSGYTIGKGFAGGMKRHNFAGNRATHGVSISHRSHGSTGQCQDPGKVFKGKKMAGRYGNVKKTMQNLKVIKTDYEKGLILVKGSIPGPKGLYVTVIDSVKIRNESLPYPSSIQKQEVDVPNASESQEVKKIAESETQKPDDVVEIVKNNAETGKKDET